VGAGSGRDLGGGDLGGELLEDTLREGVDVREELRGILIIDRKKGLNFFNQIVKRLSSTRMSLC